jgi:hypothetical protein
MNEQQRREDLDAAIRAEHDAYATMRERVPELALPLAQRPPLTARQQAAIAEYSQCRERARAARRALEAVRIDAAPPLPVVVPMPRNG